MHFSVDYTKPNNENPVFEENKQFSGRNSKRSLTMKTEAKTQPMNNFFMPHHEENEPRRNSTSLEKKIAEKAFPELEKSQSLNLPTRVIHVRGLDIKETKLIYLINLFSNFGNVKKIIFFKEIGVALIEFTLKDFAGMAVNYLNEQIVFGQQLQVY